MRPIDYDTWYDAPRGRWIGEREFRLLERLLAPRSGETLLDVGCGTGWFSRRFAAAGLEVTGLDRDKDALAFARTKPVPGVRYLPGDARRLPFPTGAFDHVISVTALCFVTPWQDALVEITRVSRARFAIGLLNRHSALWLAKGRNGGSGAYAGAHWHTRTQIEAALRELPVRDVRFRFAVFDPTASAVSRAIERMVPSCMAVGSFLAVAADVARYAVPGAVAPAANASIPTVTHLGAEPRCRIEKGRIE